MRNADAPPAGWYPDPRSTTHLRWWDGLDWTDIRRAPPSQAELIAAEENRRFYDANSTAAPNFQPAAAASGMGRQDVQQIIAEVRSVARSEVDRAAQEFSQRATTAMRGFTPLITQYTNRFVRWFKIALGFALALVVVWFLFQVFAQATLFDWIGDRIDNLTDDEGGLGFVGGLWSSPPG